MNNFQKRQKKKKNLKKNIKNKIKYEKKKKMRFILNEIYGCRWTQDIDNCIVTLMRVSRYPSRRCELGFSEDPCEYHKQFSGVYMIALLKIRSFISSKIGKNKLQELSISVEDLDNVADYIIKLLLTDGILEEEEERMQEEEEKYWDAYDEFYSA